MDAGSYQTSADVVRRCSSFPFRHLHTHTHTLFRLCLCQPHCAPVFSLSPRMGRLFSQSGTTLPSILAPLRGLADRQGQHDRIFPLLPSFSHPLSPRVSLTLTPLAPPKHEGPFIFCLRQREQTRDRATERREERVPIELHLRVRDGLIVWCAKQQIMQHSCLQSDVHFRGNQSHIYRIYITLT